MRPVSRAVAVSTPCITTISLFTFQVRINLVSLRLLSCLHIHGWWRLNRFVTVESSKINRNKINWAPRLAFAPDPDARTDTALAMSDADDGFTFPSPEPEPGRADETPSPSRPFTSSSFPTTGVFSGNARDVTVITLGVAVIASACTCWMLQVLAYLLRPLVTATGAALLLRPLVDFVSDAKYQKDVLRRSKLRFCCSRNVSVTIPRIIAILFALCVVCGVFGTLIWAMYLGRMYVVVHWQDPEWISGFNARINEIGRSVSDLATRVFRKDDVAEKAWERLQHNAENVLRDEQFWETLGAGVFHYIQDVMLMLFYTLFLLAPRREATRPRSLVARRIQKATRRFVSIMVQIAMVRALLVGSLLGLCGVPWALAIAVAIISFWLFFIPTLGSIVASLLPLPMIVLLPGLSEKQRIAGALIPNFVSFLVGDLIGPVVYRKGLDLNEVTVLLALVFWYSVWGAAGAVLGVPLTCALKIVLEEMPHEGAHALASMMAPPQSRESVGDDLESSVSVRVPMTLSFIAWVQRVGARLFKARDRRHPRDEEALLGDESDSEA